MMGFGSRDMAHGCEGVHDPIYARALFLEHAGEKALIMGFDLCLLGREVADRLKGAIGREIDLSPRQILLNTSHSHVAPSTGTWHFAGYEPPDRLYLDELRQATVRAACQAQEASREVTLWAGAARSTLPMNRRRHDERGQVVMRPNPDGVVYDRLPICLFKDRTARRPVCLLFSVSTHPSMIHGFEISAEYPGAAMDMLDEHFGTVCSLFLQGVAGDSKPSVIGTNPQGWGSGTWDQMGQAARMVVQPAIQTLETGLVQVEPALGTASIETLWPLDSTPPRSEFEAIASEPKPQEPKRDVRRLWAARQLELLDRGNVLPTAATITVHGLQLGHGLRLIGLEGEAVAQWGFLIEEFYGPGVTFPLGYSDGQGLYLPTSKMLDEGGYEVVSYWEYGYPAPLAKGMEKIVLKALAQLRHRGVS